MSATNRITIRLVGTPEEGGDLRIGVLLKKFEALKAALRATDRVISQGEMMFDYRVVNLSHSSPSTMEVDPVPLEMEAVEDSTLLVDTFFGVLTGVQESGEIPEGFGYNDLKNFGKLEPEAKAVPEVVISRNGYDVSLAGDWAKKVDAALGPDQLEIGSVTGMLQQLNVHGKNRRFTIYPTFGEPELSCKFGRELRDTVVQAVDRYVEVSGTLRYKAGSWYPHAIDATAIREFPPESQLPSLDDLFGIAPDATGEESVEGFVQRVRDGWE